LRVASCVCYDWIAHVYCLMGYHFHLLVETPEINLSMGMHKINEMLTESFNSPVQFGCTVMTLGNVLSTVIVSKEYNRQ